MIGKTIYLLAALVLVVVVANEQLSPDVGFDYKASENISHHLIVGVRQPGDRLVLKQNIIKASKWLQVVKVEQTFEISPFEIITQVRALDQKTNGNGATASLLGGGPGANSVTLKFKSKRSHGINFIVEIYAKRR